MSHLDVKTGCKFKLWMRQCLLIVLLVKFSGTQSVTLVEKTEYFKGEINANSEALLTSQIFSF